MLKTGLAKVKITSALGILMGGQLNEIRLRGFMMSTGWDTTGFKSTVSPIGHVNLWVKLTGKRNAGNSHVAFVEAGAGNVAMAETVNPTGNRKSLLGNPRPKVCAPVLDPTNKGVLEIGYGWDSVTLLEEAGRNREHKLQPLATTPVLYSIKEGGLGWELYFFKRWRQKLKGRAYRETNREAKHRKLYELLGDLPDSKRKISAWKIGEEKRRSYVLEKLLLDLNEIESVPAYFVYPQGRRGPFPPILYNHAHGWNYVLGKDELTNGRDALQEPPYAEVLTKIAAGSPTPCGWGGCHWERLLCFVHRYLVFWREEGSLWIRDIQTDVLVRPGFMRNDGLR